MTMFFIFLALIIFIVLYFIATYNNFVNQNSLCSEAWKNIDLQLKRKYELIPNLVNIVKNYTNFENDTLTKITDLRNQAMQSQSIVERSEIENKLISAIKSLFVASEFYPNLRTDSDFLSLQNNLSEIEGHIQNSKQYYNGIVRNLNSMVQSFPSNLIAKYFNFTARDYFVIDDK